jgi:hypothetical protein
VICTVLYAHAFDNSYEQYTSLLETYVCNKRVAYSDLKTDQESIDAVNKSLASLTQKQFESMSVDNQIAYYINLYNFYTLVLIVDHYPLETGIRDIRRPWAQKIVPLFGTKVSLDHVEHTLLRKKYDEPRIHFALVCASKGCPALIDTPFTGEKLDQQLDKAAQSFLTDTSRNRIAGTTVFLSQIFEWYGSDFKKQYDGYKEYVKQILELNGKYTFKFIKYDWSLNEVKSCK